MGIDRKIDREDRNEDFKVNEKLKIGVIGVGHGSGCTFVGTSLAVLLSSDKKRCVGYAQIGGCTNSGIYDALGMDKRFAGREFIDFYSLLDKGLNIRGKVNIDEKINWAIVPPKIKINDDDTKRVRENVKTIKYLKLINNLYCDTIICDFMEMHDDEMNIARFCIGDDRLSIERIYEDMDVIICVIDPMPSKLLSYNNIISKVKALQLGGYRVIWIINKMNYGINKRELKEYLRIREHYEIPLMEGALFYRAEYNCRIPFNSQEIREKTKVEFDEIIKTI